jgi:hypothetical protein
MNLMSPPMGPSSSTTSISSGLPSKQHGNPLLAGSPVPSLPSAGEVSLVEQANFNNGADASKGDENILADVDQDRGSSVLGLSFNLCNAALGAGIRELY